MQNPPKVGKKTKGTMELSRKGQYRKKRVCIVYQHCSTSMYACVGVKKEEVKKLKSFSSRPRENFPNNMT